MATQVMTVLPQALVNAKVSNIKKEYYMDNPEIAKAIEELEKRFDGAGRVLIRPSGTEPKIKIYISSIGSSVRDTLIVSPIPSFKRVPIPIADLTAPLRKVPASVTPRWRG